MKYLLLGILVQVIWSFAPLFSAQVIDGWPLNFYLLGRWALSGFLFLILALFWGRSFQKSDFFRAVSIGFVSYGVGSWLSLKGLELSGVIHFSLMSAISYPLITLWSILLVKEKPRGSFWWSLGATLIGILLLNFSGWGSFSSHLFYASLLIFGAYALETLVLVLSRPMQIRMGILSYQAVAQLSGAFFFLTIFSFDNVSYSGILFEWRYIIPFLFVSCLCCFAAILLSHFLLKHLEAHRFSLLEPIHTILGSAHGYFFRYEPVTALTFIAGALVLGAVSFELTKKTHPSKGFL